MLVWFEHDYFILWGDLMNKNKFIKIVSFFLSIPCLINSNVLGMKNNVRGASYKELLKIIRSKNRKYSYESSKFLEAKRDLFMLVIKNYPNYDSSELLKIIHYVRDSGFLIQSDKNFCKFIVPIHNNKILILNLRLEKYNHVAISGQIEENEDYGQYLPRLKGLGIDCPILFSEKWNLTLRLDENNFKILKTKFSTIHMLKNYMDFCEHSDRIKNEMKDILNKQGGSKKYKIPITRNKVADRRRDYGEYVLKELRPKNLTQKSNKGLDNGSGNSKTDKKAAARRNYNNISRKMVSKMKLKDPLSSKNPGATRRKVNFDPVFMFGKGKADKNKNVIETLLSVENKNELYNMDDTNTTVAKKDLLDFTFGE